MAKIYAPNEQHNCDYGVDFIHGVAAVPDADTATLEWFTAKGFTVVTGSDTLSPWDYLPVEMLRVFAPYAGIDASGKTKKQLVLGIEAALITLMKIEIEEFDAIANVVAGTTAEPKYADANAVKAVLPASVTATFENGSKATVPVSSWANTDTYNAAAAASYTFTATLGTIPLPFTVKAGVSATVEVVVSSAA